MRNFLTRFSAPPVEEAKSSTPSSPRLLWTRAIVLLVVVLAAAILYWMFKDRLSLQAAAGHEAQLRAFQSQHPVLTFAAALGLYVLITALSLPLATIFSLACGWFFGFWPALILVSIGSTAGATSAFLLSRYLLQDVVQRRLGERVQRFNEQLENEGAYYLFTLRLIPAVPFFVINIVMALTPMRTRTFWWVSQLGMLPATVVYVYAGSSVPNLSSLAEKGAEAIITVRLLIAFVLLGLFPLVAKRLTRRFGPYLQTRNREP